MPTLDVAAHEPVPENFTSSPAELADFLEAGINAAWAGAGISTPAIENAALALLRLRAMEPDAYYKGGVYPMGRLEPQFQMYNLRLYGPKRFSLLMGARRTDIRAALVGYIPGFSDDAWAAIEAAMTASDKSGALESFEFAI